MSSDYWSDRNCLPWATAHLTPRFRVVHAAGFVITSVATLTGDCTLNSKRGTVIPLFELQIVLTWKGTAANGEHASGQISIPDFSHDSDLEELEMHVNVDNKAQQKALAREIRDSLILKVKEILSTFTADLIRENSKESRFIKPSSNATPPPTRANQPQPTQPAGRPRPLKAPQPVATANWTSPAADSSSSTQPRTTGFGLETQLVGTASDAYDTFLNPARIRVWSRDARVEMDSRPGMEYALFGANITGRICELVPCSKIVCTWRLRSWPATLQSSLAEITMTELDGVTRVRLKHTGVPVDEVPNIKRNWEAYYFTPIRESLHVLASIPKVTPVASGMKPQFNDQEMEDMLKNMPKEELDKLMQEVGENSGGSKLVHTAPRMTFWQSVLWIFLFC